MCPTHHNRQQEQLSYLPCRYPAIIMSITALTPACTCSLSSMFSLTHRLCCGCFSVILSVCKPFLCPAGQSSVLYCMRGGQLGLSTWCCWLQMAILVCCEVLPTTLMTLPAAQGGLTVSFQLYARHMRDWGVLVPSMGPPVAALVITALLAAVARLIEHAVSPEEHVSF